MEHGRGNGVCMPVQSDTFACAIRHLHNLLSGYPFVILSGSANTRVTANQGSKLQACLCGSVKGWLWVLRDVFVCCTGHGVCSPRYVCAHQVVRVCCKYYVVRMCVARCTVRVCIVVCVCASRCATLRVCCARVFCGMRACSMVCQRRRMCFACTALSAVFNHAMMLQWQQSDPVAAACYAVLSLSSFQCTGIRVRSLPLVTMVICQPTGGA